MAERRPKGCREGRVVRERLRYMSFNTISSHSAQIRWARSRYGKSRRSISRTNLSSALFPADQSSPSTLGRVHCCVPYPHLPCRDRVPTMDAGG